MSGISNELREFLQGWLLWVEQGAPSSRAFTREGGLCIQPCLGLEELDELKGILWKEFGDYQYPFQLAGVGATPVEQSVSYSEAVVQATHHLNEDRINWVREVLNA